MYANVPIVVADGMMISLQIQRIVHVSLSEILRQSDFSLLPKVAANRGRK